MLHRDSLKDLLSQRELTNTDKVLLCLAVDVGQPKQVADIRELAHACGLRVIRNWNVSQLLSRCSGRAVRTKEGWELTSSGYEHVRKLAGSLVSSPAPIVAASLRAHLAHLTDDQISSFVEEAIRCFESKLYRAAVVLSWIGALAVLYTHVVTKELSAFNAEAKRRNAKWKDARTVDDLARMGEHDFLQILEAISVVGKSVKQELENCLKLRNGCGHPNSLKIADNRVAGHIEALLLNVFAKFKA